MEQDRTHPTVEAINRLLKERGITQIELANRLGWGRMQVHRRLVAGSPPLTVPELEHIAAVLDVSVAQLLPAEPEPAGGAR